MADDWDVKIFIPLVVLVIANVVVTSFFEGEWVTRVSSGLILCVVGLIALRWRRVLFRRADHRGGGGVASDGVQDQ